MSRSPLCYHALRATHSLMPIRSAPPLASLLAGLLAILALLIPTQAQPSPHSTPVRVATVDWTLAETLLALGVTPVGVGQIQDYNTWVGQPALPETVVDLGLRGQPNRELVASLELDHFLISPQFLALEPSLSRITPVTSLATYTTDSPLWHSLLETTRQLARMIDHPEHGEALIAQSTADIERVSNRLPRGLPPVLAIQFIDNRHVRVYGKGSLYDMVMDRLGLKNAWQGKTNAWGFATAGLEALTTEGYLVLIDPLPMGLGDDLADNRIWQALPAVRAQQVLRLPAVWSFGGLPSATRFANELGHALITASTAAPGTP